MTFSMEWMRNRYSVMMSSRRARLDGRFERAITFDPIVIAMKLLLEFPDALFHAVDEESILGDNNVWSSQP